MTSTEVKEFESFLHEAFDEDVIIRELRLSSEERRLLESIYPGACLNVIPSREYKDGKQWYEVRRNRF